MCKAALSPSASQRAGLDRTGAIHTEATLIYRHTHSQYCSVENTERSFKYSFIYTQTLASLTYVHTHTHTHTHTTHSHRAYSQVTLPDKRQHTYGGKTQQIGPERKILG